MQRALHAHMFLGGNVTGDHERITHRLRNFEDVLAGAFAHHLLHDLLAFLFAQAELLQRFIEARAGVGQFQVLAVIVDVPDIRQREDGFTAVAFTTGDSGDGPGRRNRGLGCIANAVLFDALHHRIPLDLGSAPVILIVSQRRRRLPLHIVHIVDGILDRGERSALLGKLHARHHRVIAHELHHLRAELLTFLRAITHARVIHQIRQPHDAQADAPRAVRGFLQLRHGRHIRIRLHHIIEEARSGHHRLAQSFPVHSAIRSAMLVEIHRTQTAVLVRSKPLFSARVRRFERIQMRHGVAAIGGIEEEHTRLAIMMRLLDDLVEQFARVDLLVGVDGDARGFGLFERAAESLFLHLGKVGEAQFPFFVFLHGLHERVGDADGNIEVGNVVLIDLAGDEIFHIGMVHAQDRHIGATAGIMRHHAVSKISMVVFNFQIQGERFSGFFHTANFNEPISVQGRRVLESSRVFRLQQVISRTG